MFDIVTTTATILNPQVNSAVNSIFKSLFEGLTLACVAGITYGIKLGISTIKNSLIRSFANRAVAFAAQRLTNLSDEAKRQAVAAKIHEKFPRLDEEEVNHFLEEAYVSLKASLAEAGN
jgi:hypothetical protein